MVYLLAGASPGRPGMQEVRMSETASKLINWAERFKEMVDFVGLSEADRQLIKASAPIVLAQARRLNDFMYDRLLEYPQARKFFVTADDLPDRKRIEDNKETMISWLRATVSAPANDGFVRYLVAISQMHMNIPIHRPNLSPVAPRYIIGIIAHYQSAITSLMHQHISDPDLATRTSIAWNKWLTLQIEPLLASYLAAQEQDD
jgi:hemoglobin-like flavoprotein